MTPERQNRWRIVLWTNLLLAGLFSPVAWCADHALVLTGSGPGANKGEFFRRLANDSLKIPAGNVSELKGEALSADGIRQTANRLSEKIGKSGRLWIFFAGAAGRAPLAGAPSGASCKQGIMGYDGLKAAFLPATQLVSAVDGIVQQVGHVTAIFDADFSPIVGGATCAADANAPPLATLLTKGNANVSYIGINGNSDKPGVALSDLINPCLADPRTDLDGSGAITVKELAACLQKGLAGADSRKIIAEGATGQAVAVTRSGDKEQDVAPVAEGGDVAAKAALANLFDLRNTEWSIKASTSQPQYRIGKDKVGFRIESDRSGFLYILVAGTQNDGVYLLFPNARDPDNELRPDEPLLLPSRSKWSIGVDGPAGVNKVLMIVADGELDIDQAGMTKSGAFKKSGVRKVDLARLQRSMMVRRTKSLRETPPDEADYNFGAVMLEVREVSP